MTIAVSGKICFIGYNYGGGYGKYEVSRSTKFTKRMITINKILELFSEYIISGSLDCLLTDIGTWEMKITEENGMVHSFDGALCGEVCVGDIDLTYYLRKYISVKGLIGFGDSMG